MNLSAKQIRFVKENYQTLNYRQIAEILNVSWEGLRQYAVQKLGLKRGRWGRMGWTEQEKELLLKNYSSMKKEELHSLFPNRTWVSISHQAQRMGLVHSLSVEFNEQLQSLQLSAAEAAYIAGIIDGEGSVFLLKVTNKQKTEWYPGKKGRKPRTRTGEYLVSGVMACNTDPKMMRFLHERCGGTLHSREMKSCNRKLKSHSPLFVLNVRGYRALPMIQAIKPYMITKKAAADVVERYLLLRLSKEKNALLGEEEFALYSEWRKLCPAKGSLEWAKRYST